MENLHMMRGEVARRYEALGLPSWPDPQAHRERRGEEYSTVTEPQRYRIVPARARLWADVLQEAGATVFEENIREIRPEGWPSDARPRPVDRVLRIDPPAGRSGAVPMWVLEMDGPVPAVALSAGEVESFYALHPDCGCDACDAGSEDLLLAIDEAVQRLVGPRVILRGRTAEHGPWRHRYFVDGRADSSGEVPGDYWALYWACAEIVSGGAPVLPAGVDVEVISGWFVDGR
ncbi:DUF6226 family protein [Micrococcus luteus]|uniref:DUF6226 family protein n=1 Tax=Micrococcus endophyticus TaxID=455343 RepID=UPI00130E7107|nr:DUF6226 family protein [Micrococcus endophyticus]MCK6091919.1 hypothetical protein [Micrococcus endophyticus]MCV7728060.1 DUF6226 family protein [Micrococcus luteus]